MQALESWATAASPREPNDDGQQQNATSKDPKCVWQLVSEEAFGRISTRKAAATLGIVHTQRNVPRTARASRRIRNANARRLATELGVSNGARDDDGSRSIQLAQVRHGVHRVCRRRAVLRVRDDAH